MNELLKKLNDLLHKLEIAKNLDLKPIVEVKNILQLYVSKFFNNNPNCISLLEEVETNPEEDWQYEDARTRLTSIINTLIEEINISENNFLVQTEEEKQKILSNARKEAEKDRVRIEKELDEIQKIKDEIQREKNSLLAEQEKFDTFKTKLEVADKKLDFQLEAKKNNSRATVWAILALILICVLIYVLFDGLNVIDTFSKITSSIELELGTLRANHKSPIYFDDIISRTIYFTFSKYILPNCYCIRC
jgi:hypothetical protein